jgi:VWFA-related protein
MIQNRTAVSSSTEIRMEKYMRFFGFAIVAFFAFCQCVGQTAKVESPSTMAFSESIEFRSQVGAYLFKSGKKIKIESYTLPQLKFGEETATGPITTAVSVLDRNARPVTDLTAKDFSLIVDGVVCKLETVEKLGEYLHVIFLLDRSPSSGELLKVMRDNAKTLLRNLPPDSVVSIATLGLKLKFKREPTKDRILIEKEIDKIKDFEDGTSLYDALKSLARDPRANAKNTAIVLITDGIDTTSGTSIGASFGSLESAKAAIYPVYLDSYTAYLKSRPNLGVAKPGSTIVPGLGRVLFGHPEPSQEDADMGRMYLNDLASLSGGRPVVASHVENLAPFDLGQELSSKYLITFSPSARYINQRLHLRVRVARPNLTVLTRSNLLVSK